MPFLGAESALTRVRCGWMAVFPGSSPSGRAAPFSEAVFWPWVKRGISGEFFVKTYRKGTRSVQKHPVTV
jgi:hypothetical protein